MTRKIVVAGSGFAGMWAAISAARAVVLTGREQDIEVTIVSPSATLAIRPRLYEAVLENMNPDIAPLLEAVGVRHIAGLVRTIDAGARRIGIEHADGTRTNLPYDKFVLATGSRLFQPPVPGLAEHSFNVDQLENARALDGHLKSLAGRPETVARNTVVVAGGASPALRRSPRCRSACARFWAATLPSVSSLLSRPLTSAPTLARILDR
jgi:NADH:ubiquinone reductase (H+-translocating)